MEQVQGNQIFQGRGSRASEAGLVLLPCAPSLFSSLLCRPPRKGCPLFLQPDFLPKVPEPRLFALLQLARLTWWTRHRPHSELKREARESTAGTADVPSGEGPTGAGGTENPRHGQKQPAGRLRAHGGSSGGGHQVMGPKDPIWGVTGDGVSKGVPQISPLLPSQMAIKRVRQVRAGLVYITVKRASSR